MKKDVMKLLYQETGKDGVHRRQATRTLRREYQSEDTCKNYSSLSRRTVAREVTIYMEGSKGSFRGLNQRLLGDLSSQRNFRLSTLLGLGRNVLT